MEDLPVIERIQLRKRVVDTVCYRYVNENYIKSVPASHADENDQTIIDYERHCYGWGDYDKPDKVPFNIFGSSSSYHDATDKITKISISSCEQLIALSLYSVEDNPTNLIKLSEVLRDILVLTPEESASLVTIPTEETETNPESVALQTAVQIVSLMTTTTILIVEFTSRHAFCTVSSHESKCLSAAFLSIFLSFPNARAIQISKLYNTTNSLDISLFANFPSPRPLSTSPFTAKEEVESDETFSTVSSALHILSFRHCSAFHPTDLSFLTDCAVEHRVFPHLRHLQCYYCQGMSYPSVVAASEAMNLDFDRSELSGWNWPQEAVNGKNRGIHC